MSARTAQHRCIETDAISLYHNSGIFASAQTEHCLTVRSNYEHCRDRRRIIRIQSLHDFLLSSPKKHIIFYYFRIKKRQTSFLGLFVSFGRSDWIRTSGLLVPNQALYRTEPHPVFNFSFTIVSHVFGFVNTFSQKTRAV